MKNYVKEYKGHAVPGGATHYYDGDFDGLSFYKMRKGEAYSYHEHDTDWVFCSDGGFFSNSERLPLATEQDLPNWDEAPTDTCVWIQDNKAEAVSDFSGWYNEINDDGQYYECGGGDYVHSRNSDMFTVYSRSIAPIAPIAKEWGGKGLPPENIQCLFESPSRWGKGKKVCITGMLFNSVDGEKRLCEVEGVWYDGFENQFSSLKTQEEKDREAFGNAVYKELGKIELDLDCVGDRKRKEKAIANIMFKAGFTAPKEGE